MTSPHPIDVLLVEDDPGDELITREAFEHHKIANTLHVAHDGAEGLDFLYRRGQFSDAPRPDLILLDLNLPKRSGHWVLSRIRRSSRCSSVPVVIVSSSNAETDLNANRQLGATAYFRKPSNLEQFMNLGAVVSSLL